MSNKRRLRVPGRYERPAELRAPLGDRLGEIGIRAGFRTAVEVNTAAERRRRRPPQPGRLVVGGPTPKQLDAGVDLTPYVTVDPPGHDVLVDRHRQVVAHLDGAESMVLAAPDGPVATVESHRPVGARHVRPYLAPALAAAADRVAEVVAATVESAATAERVELHEAAAGGAVREAKPGSGGVYVIDVIKSGWNTSKSRYYSAPVIERDVPRIYGKGTHMYIDHPRASEQQEQPERSLTTLAAVFLEDPWPVREDDGRTVMRTTARVFGPWQGFVADAWPHIGVSINGHGHGNHGEAEGQYGLVLEELTYGQSVDFVTRPGAGGRVVGLLESAREAASSPAGRAAILREAGTLGAYVESRIHLGFTSLADDLYGEGRVSRAERITLSGAIGDALGVFVSRVEADAPQLYQRHRWDSPEGVTDTAEAAAVRTREATAEEQARALSAALTAAYGDGGNGYVWTRDYDPDRGVVWFETNGAPIGAASATWQQSYTRTADGRVDLVGDRVEVRPRTVYEPVRPDTTPAVTAEAARTTETTAGHRPAGSDPGPAPDITRETDMGTTDPVVAREAEQLATVTRERDDARTELARYRAGDTARPMLDQLLAESTLPPAAQARVRAGFPTSALPLTESMALDEARFRVAATAAITAEAAYVAQLAEAGGAGQVTGMGALPGAGTGAPAGGALPGAFGAATGTRESDATDQATVEALVQEYTSRGMTREAALAAANGRR